MSAIHDLTQALQNLQPPGAPAVRLVRDPLVLALRGYQDYPSLVIPGMGCAQSVCTLAYWMVRGLLLAEDASPGGGVSSYPQMVSFHARAFPSFPVYVHVNGNTMLHTLGRPRDDGWRMVFFPAGVLHNVNAHWAFLCVLHENPTGQLLIYYGDVPLVAPNIYWHSRRSSPEFLYQQSQGLACTCEEGYAYCSHRPARFAGALKVAFSDRTEYPSIDAILEPVSLGYGYSRGQGNTLVHTSINYTVTRVKAIFNNTSVYPLSQKLVFSDCTFMVHHLPPPVKLTSSIAAVVASCVGAFFLARPKPVVEASFFSMIKVVRPPSRMPLRRFIAGALVSFSTSLLFYKLLLRRRTQILQGPVPELSPLWLPPSLSGLPFARQLLNRTAIGSVDRSTCRATLKRLVAQSGHVVQLDPFEVEAWLDNVSTSIGTVPYVGMVGKCHYCLQKRSLRKLRCAECRRGAYLERPIYDIPCFVGMVPLMSQHPRLPDSLVVPFRNSFFPHTRNFSFRVIFRGKRLSHVSHALDLYWADPPQLKQMGFLAGPMWLGMPIRCFPRGILTALVAFSVRMAADKTYDPHPGFWEAMQRLFPLFVNYETLEPWPEALVVDHQRTRQKRDKLISVYTDFDMGHALPHRKLFTFGAFPKGEKHCPYKWSNGFVVSKDKAVPRLINNPPPELNALMAPYVLPIAKWFSRQWSCHSNLFYAGCSPPKDINIFLNNAVEHLSWVLEDDVSMMDGSQTLPSQQFFQHIASRLYAGADWQFLRQLMEGCASFKVRQDGLVASLYGPNASGVPPTSIFNSVTTGVARVFALIFALFGIRFDDPRIVHYVEQVIKAVYMAVAGDDGLLILPSHILGKPVSLDAQFLEAYSEGFRMAGYDVGASKIRVHSSSQWRLSTFLAMRPYWSGNAYEYGVEISRRMTSMFWLYDKAHHPFAWGRGVAVSLLKSSAHVPVIVDICKWYLDRTKNITQDIELVSFTNPYSSVYGYEVEGTMTSRTIMEFCDDYGASVSLYEDFRAYLWRQDSVLVNLDHPLLHLIYQRE